VSARFLAPANSETFGPAEVVKCCCRLGLMGEDCASWWCSFQDVWPVVKDRCAVGEALNRLLGLDNVWSNEAMYVRLRWPVLPLLEPIASEKKGALRGELIRVLEGYGRSEALDDESDMVSPSRILFRRISSSIFGSMVSSVRSSQPCLVLNCARASLFWRRRAIFGDLSVSRRAYWQTHLVHREGFWRHTLLISALLRTLSATVSGCFFHGDDMVLFFGMDGDVEGEQPSS
jgi:hypothetical protein